MNVPLGPLSTWRGFAPFVGPAPPFLFFSPVVFFAGQGNRVAPAGGPPRGDKSPFAPTSGFNRTGTRPDDRVPGTRPGRPKWRPVVFLFSVFFPPQVCYFGGNLPLGKLKKALWELVFEGTFLVFFFFFPAGAGRPNKTNKQTQNTHLKNGAGVFF